MSRKGDPFTLLLSWEISGACMENSKEALKKLKWDHHKRKYSFSWEYTQRKGNQHVKQVSWALFTMPKK